MIDAPLRLILMAFPVDESQIHKITHHPVVSQEAQTEPGTWLIYLMYASVWIESVYLCVGLFFPLSLLCPFYMFLALLFPGFGVWMYNSETFEPFFRVAKITTLNWRWFFQLFGYDLWQDYANGWVVFVFWISLPSNFLWGLMVMLLLPLGFLLAEMLV